MSLADLWCMLGGEPGYHSFSIDGKTVWCPVENERGFLRHCRILGDLGDLELGAVPFRNSAYTVVTGANVLWARCETRKSCELLSRFRPEPTLVLAEGDSVRQTAFWALTQPLEPDYIEPLNRRLAHALGCPKKFCNAWFRFHPPGCVLREGRSRPVLVSVDGGSGELYGAREVVGHLPKAPDPDAWREWKKS